MSYLKLHNSGSSPVTVGASVDDEVIRVEIPGSGYAVVNQRVGKVIQENNPALEVSDATKKEYLTYRSQKEAEEKRLKKEQEEAKKRAEEAAKKEEKEAAEKAKVRAKKAEEAQKEEEARLKKLREQELAAVEAEKAQEEKVEQEQYERVKSMVEMAVESVLDRLGVTCASCLEKGSKKSK